ncbi:DUF3078 domain-containing protein [Rubrolithibacter danxiaensis]|uniref:DUF3078 domain-containing protein n=1 Tax=Rubrolithibacter danxiaensis TaxID=3390805 RepID=UPI003BF85109
MFWKTLLIISLTAVSFCYAQEKAQQDSVDLSNLRQYPKKNALPVRQPVLQIVPVQIPEKELDIKVNYWKNWIAFGINLNQAAFSNNWSGGGVNSIALGTNFNYKVDYTKEDRNYVSEVVLQYGKLKNRDQLERKTNDRIFWDNKLALKVSKNWNFFGSVSFESQFDRGYNFGKDSVGNETRTLISGFMSPGYLTESLGFEYKPSKYFWLRLGTGTARQTFVLDNDLYLTNPKNYGVEPGKSFRNELALQVVASIDKNIASNINLKSRYSLFANYEKLGNIDHRLDFLLTANITRFVNVGINAIAVYDDDASTKIQASQALSLGLAYKFPPN